MAFTAVFLILTLLAVPAVYGVDHTVGGSSGWDQGVNFATWAAGQKFVVGDNLIFNYGSSHSVDEISQSDYNSCTASNALNKYTGGQNTVALKKSGPIYFLCPSFGHCSAGMKLSITVAAASTPTTPATPTPTTPSTPTPTTPSTPTPTTPSTPPKEDTPPPTSPGSPSTPTDSPNGAVGGFGDLNKLVVGVSIVFAGLMGFMG